MIITEKELEQLISESIIKEIYINESNKLNEEQINEWAQLIVPIVKAVAKPLLKTVGKSVAKQGMKWLVKNGMKSAGKQILKGGAKNIASGAGQILTKIGSDPNTWKKIGTQIAVNKAVDTIGGAFSGNKQENSNNQSGEQDQASDVTAALGDTSEMENAINKIQSDTANISSFSDSSNTTSESNNRILNKNQASLNEEQLRKIIKDIVFESIIKIKNNEFII